MSRITLCRGAGGLLMGLLMAGLAFGQSEPSRASSDPPAAKRADALAGQTKRLAYLVRNGSAADLASVLSKYFKEDAEAQVLAEPTSNCLLIRATPAAFAEIVKLLDQLDRRPKVMAIEVTIIELKLPARGPDEKPIPHEKVVDAAEFSGPADTVRARVDALRQKGLIGDLKQIRLTAVENQKVSLLVGETKPMVTGSVISATGIATKSVTYRNVGVSVNLTARATPDRDIVLKLDVQDSRLHTPEEGIVIGGAEKGPSIRAAETISVTLNTLVTIPSGQAVLAKDLKTSSRSQQGQTFVIISAHLEESERKPGK